MLEFFRRHKGPFMIGITVVIIITFSYWGGSRRGAGLANMKDDHATAFTIFGRDYTGVEMGRLGRTQMLCYYLGLYDLLGLGSVAEQLKSIDSRGPSYDFIANLLVLREKAVEFGVAASDEDAIKRLQTLQPFQKDGKFDENTAASMEERLGANGFSKADLLQLVKDQIAYDRLQDVVGANYSPSPHAVTKGYAANQQTLKASTVTLALDDFKKKAEVKDDEISKYYEEKKEGYKTPEKRAVSYVLFEKPKPDEKKKAEENAAATKTYEETVNEFDQELKAPGADIAALVTKFQKKSPGIKLETLPAFDRATPAAAIKDEPRFVQEAFRVALGVNSYGDPVDGTKGYYFLKITQIDAPKQQELKEVKDKIKEILITQKAQEAVLKAANDARTALQDGLKAGKKLDELVKDKGWKVEALPDFSPNNPPAQIQADKDLTEQAGKTPAGSVTKPSSSDKGAVLLVVTAKELRKSDSAASLKTSEESTQASQAKTALFKSWFGKVRSEANMHLASQS